MLKPINIVYRCGSADGWSKQYSFLTLPEGSEWSPRLAIYGDLGRDNAQSVPRLTKDVQNNMYDVIFHIGDFAYDMHSVLTHSCIYAFPAL
jgi:hypothetical protein